MSVIAPRSGGRDQNNPGPNNPGPWRAPNSNLRQRDRRSAGSGSDAPDKNYRHAFHAGNFADLQKHAIVLALLKALTADAAPLSVIDTHAGAGAYDLGGDMALRSGEAAAGIGRLLASDDVPAV